MRSELNGDFNCNGDEKVRKGVNEMTQKEAKEISLELWKYLAEHPECGSKENVPLNLDDIDIRERAAGRIVEIVSAWEPEY
jgi:hypothetical protein